jgi:UDP-N-acetylmuramoyl-tripeptide--D-alanyl-D-alanine ligase
MKKAAKAFVVSILAWQVRRLRKKNNFKVVAVVGSIGKTSTKFAIAQTLSENLRVRFQEGNYNDIVSVPLVFFGHNLPSLTNPFAWLKIFLNNERQITKLYPYDVVVVELGTDAPGQIMAFKRYIDADIAVVTAISPEHMEYFTGLPAVAEEELAVAAYAKKLLINTDLCANEYTAAYSGSFLSYAIKQDATYWMNQVQFDKTECDFTVQKDRQVFLDAQHSSFAEPQLYSLLAAIAVADLLGVPPETIINGLNRIQPVAGRMQRLPGINGSTIIDDTYNASPEATKAALDTLYRLPASQKIALLGNMNELGTFSAKAHADIGVYCDPEQLGLVVTLGPDANLYLAEAAEKNGCKVVRTESPYEAAEHITKNLSDGTLVLVKGSQNKVFAEEAVKLLLADPGDAGKLVRQSPSWLSIKQQQFSKSKTEVK